MLTIDAVSAHRGKLMALSDISLTLDRGKTLAVTGESGAGKSTLIACILGLLKPSGGTITWSGAPVRTCRPALVMQEPRMAFNPALPLLQSVLEPLKARRAMVLPDRLTRLCKGLELSPELLDRKPAEVSIGQAQRAGILRALVAAPPLILFDEPLSALDSVTQKHTARLIAELQAEEGFSSLIVTHDLGYACACSDRIAVLRSGRIEEAGTPGSFVAAPQTEYGKKLRDAAFALGALEAAE
ncbi:MAG: ATP-binding cassette domain-containing protein [Rhodobacteraceae bacterium]|nr:ATP-binding cassette domain-containing protein [Paracoccaceae bacterium]